MKTGMPDAKKKGIVHVLAEAPDGHRLVARESEGEVRVGALCPHVEEGKPFLPGREYVHLEKRADGAYDCESLFGGDGPAQVASESYRSGWDAIWGKKPASELN
jgi:hypothetical protein